MSFLCLSDCNACIVAKPYVVGRGESAMVPFDKTMTSSYTLSIVTIPNGWCGSDVRNSK